jgi:glucan biosynthesis protein C
MMGAAATQEGTAKIGAGMRERIHALDGLRALMLFLVVLFHCVLSYTVAPSRVWTFKGDMTTLTADFVVRFVHAFTLPTFFILAGFFSAMLYLRRGSQGFARNRAMRIALPFAVGWLILHPLVAGGFLFAREAQASSLGEGWASVQRAMADGSLFFRDSTLHLWFMYDLIFFYAAILAVAPLVMRVPAAWRESTLAIFGSILAQPLLRLPLLALISTAMLRTVGGTLYASLSFVPNWELLLGYGLYFGFGWLVFLKRELLPRFERFAWTQALAGLAIFLLLGPAVRLVADGPISRSALFTLSTLVGGTVVWLLFFGLTGLFLRHFNRPSPAARYAADASFWIYLIHLPLVIWLAGAFSGLAVLPWLKVLMILGAVYFVGFTTYDLFVRSTAVGAVISGRRYPRVLFGARAESVPA